MGTRKPQRPVTVRRQSSDPAGNDRDLSFRSYPMDSPQAAARILALALLADGTIQLSELGQALVSDNPQEAHAIINECAAALQRMDHRVMGLEGRVTAIERHIHPP